MTASASHFRNTVAMGREAEAPPPIRGDLNPCPAVLPVRGLAYQSDGVGTWCLGRRRPAVKSYSKPQGRKDEEGEGCRRETATSIVTRASRHRRPGFCLA